MYKISLIRKDKNYTSFLGLADVSAVKLEELTTLFLSADEISAFNSIKGDNNRKNFLKSRFITKLTVAQHFSKADLTSIQLRHGVFDFPLIECRELPAVQVSISHSGDTVACIVFPDEHPMAIDVEEIKEGSKDEIATQITKEEKELFKGLSENEDTFFTRLWTIKEALSKVLKTGMTASFELYKIDSIKHNNGFCLSTFTNFIQYKAVSYNYGNSIVTVVLPERTEWRYEKIKQIEHTHNKNIIL